MIAMDLDLAGHRAAQASDGASAATWRAPITVQLPFVGPYDWPAMVGFLGQRAIPGVESVADDRYRRTIEVDGQHGMIDVGPTADGRALEAMIAFPDIRSVPAIVERIGRLFDLAADIETIGADLARDPALAPLITARPGLRVPGAWDGFELAVRGILGQQITVAGARTLAGRLVERHGQPLRVDHHAHGLTAVFPGPGALRDANLAALGVPGARVRALANLAAAAAGEPDLLEPCQGLELAVARLRALPGIGEWTAQYIAMRAMREPDAFPSADVGLLRAVTPPGGSRPTPADLLARAEAWRPWRAYAALHLWTSLPAAGSG